MNRPLRVALTHASAVAIAVVLAACSGSGGGGGVEPVDPPVEPDRFELANPGTPGVMLEQDPNQPIRLRFSEAVDPSSLRPESILLLSRRRLVPASRRLDPGASTTVEVSTDRPLASGAFYRLVVTPGLRAQSGATLEGSIELALRTRDLRTWSAAEIVQSDVSRIDHVIASGDGGVHLLTRSALSSSTSRFSSFEPSTRAWRTPEVLPAPALGLHVDARSNTVTGALVEGLTGFQMLRGGRGWLNPSPIPVQPSPALGIAWPSSRAYEWIPGTSASNALRLGPLVHSSRDGETHCRVITGAQAFEAPYPNDELIHTAIAIPGSEPIMLGRRLRATFELFARRIDTAESTNIAEVPFGSILDNIGLATNAYGGICASWSEAELQGSVQLRENARVALYDDATRTWSPPQLIQSPASGARIVGIVTSPSPNGDALVAVPYGFGNGTTVIALGQHLSPAVPITPATGPARRGWNQLSAFGGFDTAGQSIALAHDVGGHGYMAWINAVPGQSRALAVRRFDLEDGWQPNFDELANSITIDDVHLVPDGHGNMLLLWLEDGTVYSRWFRQPG